MTMVCPTFSDIYFPDITSNDPVTTSNSSKCYIIAHLYVQYHEPGVTLAHYVHSMFILQFIHYAYNMHELKTVLFTVYAAYCVLPSTEQESSHHSQQDQSQRDGHHHDGGLSALTGGRHCRRRDTGLDACGAYTKEHTWLWLLAQPSKADGGHAHVELHCIATHTHTVYFSVCDGLTVRAGLEFKTSAEGAVAR